MRSKHYTRFIRSAVMKYGVREIFIVGDLKLDIKGVETRNGKLDSPVEGYDLIIIQDEIDDVSQLQNIKDCNLIIAPSPDKKMEMPPYLLGAPTKKINEIGLWDLKYARQATNNWTGVGSLWNPLSV